MILECTECRTRYLVPDSAIGASGRTVRCASCKHSWFQTPQVLDLATPTTAADAGAERPREARSPAPAQPQTAQTQATQPQQQPQPRRVFEDTAIGAPAPEYDPFAAQPPFKPRRNPARRWTAAALVAGLSMLLGAGVILYAGAPGIASQFNLDLGLGIGGEAETPLRFTDKNVELRTMPNGSELFAVSGKVVNPTGQKQHVPDIRVELRDQQDRLVYSWRITPGQRGLDPNGSVEFNSARVDVPANARVVELSFASEIGG